MCRYSIESAQDEKLKEQRLRISVLDQELQGLRLLVARLGALRYEGIQTFPGGELRLFTEEGTGTSIALKPRETLAEAVKRVDAVFKATAVAKKHGMARRG